MASGVQRKMARRRAGHTTAVIIGAERFHLVANQGDDGSLGEVFIHWGKHGTSGAGLANAYAIALSMGLRHRVPLPELIRPGLDQDFRPNGRTDDPEIPRVRSAVDYVARRLAIDWLPYADRAALGVFSRSERVRHRRPEAGHPALLGRLSDVEAAQEPPGGVRCFLADFPGHDAGRGQRDVDRPRGSGVLPRMPCSTWHTCSAFMRRSSVMMPRRCAPALAALRSRRCCRRAISSGVSSMSRLDHSPSSLTAR